LGLLAMVVLISGCYGPAAQPGQNNVNIESFAYDPATITVQARYYFIGIHRSSTAVGSFTLFLGITINLLMPIFVI